MVGQTTDKQYTSAQKTKHTICNVTYMHFNVDDRLRVELGDPRVPSRIFLLPSYQCVNTTLLQRHALKKNP
jgi:hypothetical protein